MISTLHGSGTEVTATIITPFVVLAGVGSLLSAFLLGLVICRTRPFPHAWLPLFIPIGFLLSMIALIGLEGLLGDTAASERLLELPVVLLGLAWMWLGIIMFAKGRA